MAPAHASHCHGKAHSVNGDFADLPLRLHQGVLCANTTKAPSPSQKCGAAVCVSCSCLKPCSNKRTQRSHASSDDGVTCTCRC